MKYKLIACDFDDTLLRSDNTVSKRTVEAISRYRAAGGVFMVTTGRMNRSIIQRMDDIGLTENVPVASYQGALIKESLTGKVLKYAPLDFDNSYALVKEAEDCGLFVQIYHDDTLIFKDDTGEKAHYGLLYAKKQNVPYRAAGKLSAYIEKNKLCCTKVLIMEEPDKMAPVYRHFTEKFGGRCVINTSSPYFLEAIDNNAGKDKACDFICGSLGIAIDSCIAIGDSMNDFTMVGHAGLGVAVANARQELKDAAKYIAKSNDDDGVAEVIEKFCL